MCGVWTGVIAELQRPNIIDLYRLAALITERTKESARSGIERIDPASRNVVADQNRVAHRTKIGRSLSETPGRMERTLDGKPSLEAAVGIKDVHKATHCFVEGGVGDPNFAADVLNPIGRKIFRDLRVVKDFTNVNVASNMSILLFEPSSAAYRNWPAVVVAMANPVYTAPTPDLSAFVRVALTSPVAPSTFGFQAMIVPSSVAKMKLAGPDVPFPVIMKSVGLMFPTMPVGVPRVPARLPAAGGIDTTRFICRPVPV